MAEQALSVFAVPGVRLGTTSAGVKHAGRVDLMLMEIRPGATAAAVFTRNAFRAAPVMVAEQRLTETPPRFLLVNSGNANAGTGARGLADARTTCRDLAELAGCAESEVLPFSTGVIGEYLPVDRLRAALPLALAALAEDGWAAAARAIMTTDTVPKLVSREYELEGHRAVVTGIAKGAGMICPDMATMLAFVATDAAVEGACLRSCLKEAVEVSFNAITVDGDTSTNDSCVLVATGAGGAPRLTDTAQPGYQALREAVESVCRDLARAIIRDAEGATRVVEVVVEQAASVAEARGVAYTVAHSPLVKTALFAGDPNWGRILAAVGRAGIPDLDVGRVGIQLDDVCIVRGGARDPAYTEQAGQAVMARPEFVIRIDLGRGPVRIGVLTCDLSYDYVKINAEYRT